MTRNTNRHKPTLEPSRNVTDSHNKTHN